MRRPAVAAACLAGLATLLPLASPAAAASGGGRPVTAVDDAEDVITRYDLAVDLGDDGVADVTLDIEVDFGAGANHGPYLTYLVKQRFDDTRDRVYRLTDVRASSDTAPDDVDVEEEGALLVVRIGDEDEEVTGRHAYRVTFTAEGWVNSSTATGSDDELYLDVLEGWQVPVEDASVTVTGPDDAVGAVCFAGPRGSDAPCDAASADGRTATFAQGRTEPGEDLTVVAAFPAGTFGGVDPILQDRWAFSRAFAVDRWTGPLALLVLVGGAAVAARQARLRGRDEQYLGLTPGLQPAPGHEGATGSRRSAPVGVQFTPPAGFRPGQLGTLVDEHADAHDVTATVVDLAVRGHLRIEDVSEPGARTDRDWELVRLVRDDDAALVAYERLLLDEVFEGRDRVRLSALRTTFAASTSRVQDALYDDVTGRGWFRGNPKQVRTAWALAGVGLVVLGVVATVLLAIWTSFALVGAAVLLVGVLVTSLTRAAPARTAAGSAVLAQAEGFRRYLATAEADQLRFEEGEDVFSRYLPHAIAFGIADRWARVFADLAAQGRDVPVPAWYVGTYPHAAFWAGGGFVDGLASFTGAAESALTAPTPGSSGSSGTGGYSGGGVGGGGGGTW